jgi:hypothetical protein
MLRFCLDFQADRAGVWSGAGSGADRARKFVSDSHRGKFVLVCVGGGGSAIVVHRN